MPSTIISATIASFTVRMRDILDATKNPIADFVPRKRVAVTVAASTGIFSRDR
jgi:hypothetical protein